MSSFSDTWFCYFKLGVIYCCCDKLLYYHMSLSLECLQY